MERGTEPPRGLRSDASSTGVAVSKESVRRRPLICIAAPLIACITIAVVQDEFYPIPLENRLEDFFSLPSRERLPLLDP